MLIALESDSVIPRTRALTNGACEIVEEFLVVPSEVDKYSEFLTIPIRALGKDE